MSGHTKGPWAQDFHEWGDGKMEFSGWINGADGARVVEYAGCGSHDAEWSNPADLTLALAAPDLLEALQMARYHVSICGAGDELAKVQAAIAKARGEK